MENNQNPEQNQDQTQDQTTKTSEEIRAEIEAEYQKKLQSEVDRRITDAMKKKEAEIAEKERLAKMSEEEKIAEIQKQKESEILKRETAIREKELGILLRDTLVEQGLPVQLKDLFQVNAYVGKEDSEFVDSIKNFKGIFDGIVNERVEEAKSQFLKGTTPKSEQPSNKHESGVSKEQFRKMTYKERVELMNSNPELYKQLSAL